MVAMAAAAMAQANVLRVGAAQPFATIQAAVQAAVDGDVVEVDAGSYPAFTVTGKSVAVIANKASGATFVVAGAPAITVTGLQTGQHVTIANARMTATATGPAIVVSGASGS